MTTKFTQVQNMAEYVFAAVWTGQTASKDKRARLRPSAIKYKSNDSNFKKFYKVTVEHLLYFCEENPCKMHKIPVFLMDNLFME